jgi:hypothetical protein
MCERAGIPACCITRYETYGSANSAFRGYGLPPELPSVQFSYDLAMVGSDMSVLDPKIDDIIGCLVKGLPKSWKPTKTWKIGDSVSSDPVSVSITGTDYANALYNTQNYYLTKRWGDALPVVPATQDKIDWMMTGTDHKADEIVGGGEGTIFSKMGVLTYRLLANMMVMAGCRPEYMPVAEAAAKSWVDYKDTFDGNQSSAPVTIVNGPVADQIRLGNGYHLWGPDGRHPAGKCIARAIWSIHQNLGGMNSSEATIGLYGMLRPGICFAENEEGRPAGWTTYAEQLFKRKAGANSVTSHSATTFISFSARGAGKDTKEVELDQDMDKIAVALKTTPSSGVAASSAGSTPCLVLNAHVCRFWNSAGYTREIIQKKVSERCFYNLAEIMYFSAVKDAYAAKKIDISKEDPLQRFFLFTDPTRIHICCAGGNHTTSVAAFPGMDAINNFEVVLPKSWDSLLAQALKDLGPMPPKGEGGIDL